MAARRIGALEGLTLADARKALLAQGFELRDTSSTRAAIYAVQSRSADGVPSGTSGQWEFWQRYATTGGTLKSRAWTNIHLRLAGGSVSEAWGNSDSQAPAGWEHVLVAAILSSIGGAISSTATATSTAAGSSTGSLVTGGFSRFVGDPIEANPVSAPAPSTTKAPTPVPGNAPGTGLAGLPGAQSGSGPVQTSAGLALAPGGAPGGFMAGLTTGAGSGDMLAPGNLMIVGAIVAAALAIGYLASR